MRGSGSRRLEVLAAVAVLVLVASACTTLRLGPGDSRGGGSRGGLVRIAQPADGTQVIGDDSVPVALQLAGGVDPASVRAYLDGPSGTMEVTDALVADGARMLTGTVHVAEAGPSRLRVEASRGHGHHTRPEATIARLSYEPTVDLAHDGTCDPLAPVRCLMPFPNDFFTVADAGTPTGRRVHFDPASMPSNSSGVQVDPTEWNRNDGFSPGAMIVTYVPGLDLAQTGAAPITDIGASLAADAPIVLLDADTGERAPYWAEMDAQADPSEGAALIVRVAKNLTEGHRYVVALRNLKDGSGVPIAATRAFQLYRDAIPTYDARFEARRAHLEDVFTTLGAAGVARDGSLALAWDFTVASTESLAGRMLHIRDDAFASLAGGVPAFQVTAVQDQVDDHVLRRVSGTFTVPSYLTGDGSPGSRFHYDDPTNPDALPTQNGTIQAGFICNIPRSVSADRNGAAPITAARGAVYGHGLLGSNTEVNASNVRTMGDTYDIVFCATKWIGFSNDDIGVAASTLQELSNFPKVADRTQQGFLDFLFLARLVKDPRGFASDPAFQMGASDTPVLDGTVAYDGNSQGGILGGAVTAVSTEWTRAVLGVPGMNYSTLLQRSVDFDTYRQILEPAYPSELDRIVGFSFLQMLWDRAEADGYANHMTSDPYPGTPAHTVLMHVAYGDHQVANVAAEVEARTIGAHLLVPALAPGRSPDVVPQWGIPTITTLPWSGSAIVYWDAGTPTPPLGNTPPRPPLYGDDPHEAPRRTPAAQLQKSQFLEPGGAVVDTCGGQPCVAT